MKRNSTGRVEYFLRVVFSLRLSSSAELLFLARVAASSALWGCMLFVKPLAPGSQPRITRDMRCSTADRPTEEAALFNARESLREAQLKLGSRAYDLASSTLKALLSSTSTYVIRIDCGYQEILRSIFLVYCASLSILPSNCTGSLSIIPSPHR